jgi:hypothetical protein
VKTRSAVLALLVLASLMPLSRASAAVGVPSRLTAAAPCVGSARPAHVKHVVWIVLENVGYSVVGSPSAPYLNGLGAKCALATNDLAVSHPSLPNYIALTSGSTQGVTDDAEPVAHRLNVPNIFSQLHGNWRALVESMPGPCAQVTSGSYAARHNPAVYYTNLGSSCLHNDVPLASKLPLGAAFTFIVPDICNDMHSCPVATGDSWLARLVPKIIASPQYQSRSLVLFITFDEDGTQATNRVPTYVIAPSVPRGRRVGAPLTHYSLLATTETLLGVPLLGSAKSARTMVDLFHL